MMASWDHKHCVHVFYPWFPTKHVHNKQSFSLLFAIEPQLGHKDKFILTVLFPSGTIYCLIILLYHLPQLLNLI